MKILKIILVFIIVIGGVYLATQWNKVFSSGGEVADTSPINVNEKCNEIRTAWASENNWNEDLLKSQMNTLQREKKLKRYKSDDDYETVRNAIRSASTDKLCDAIFREFHSPSCDDDLVNLNYSGVDVLSNTFGMNNDGSLQKVRQVKTLYDKISRFVRNNPHPISPRYNAASNSWTSYDALEKGIRNKAAEYRDNPVYKTELNKITRFINGLNDNNIKVKPSKGDYYVKLSNQIKSHFSRADATIKNKKEYFDAIDRFSKEFPNESVVDAILGEYEIFKNKCDSISSNNL